MSERITEAELQVIERLEEENRSALLFALRLVAEVRRLRRVIVEMYLALETEPGPIDPHATPFDAFEDEARAIAEERGTPSKRLPREETSPQKRQRCGEPGSSRANHDDPDNSGLCIHCATVLDENEEEQSRG